MTAEATTEFDATNDSPSEEASSCYAEGYALVSKIGGSEQESLQVTSPLNWLPLHSSANLGLRSLLSLSTRQQKSKLHQENAKRLAAWRDKQAIRMCVPKSILKSVNNMVLEKGN